MLSSEKHNGKLALYIGNWTSLEQTITLKISATTRCPMNGYCTPNDCNCYKFYSLINGACKSNQNELLVLIIFPLVVVGYVIILSSKLPSESAALALLFFMTCVNQSATVKNDDQEGQSS